MATTDPLQLVQIGDIALYGHLAEMPLPELAARGGGEELLDSYRVLIPHAPNVVESRKWTIKLEVYAAHGRSRAQLINQLSGLINRVTDFIAVEFIDNDSDALDRYPRFAASGTSALWLHNRGRIRDVQADGDGTNHDVRLSLELFTFWQPLNPAIWVMKRRNEALPRIFRQASFNPDEDIVALPEPKTFFQLDVPYSFQKRIYEDQGFHYDPAYFIALVAQHDHDLPIVRYASDWQVDIANAHYIQVDKARWSAPPLSLYLFKNMTSASEFTIRVEHEHEVWDIQETITSIDVAAIDSAMTDAGYTLLDTDILVVGDVENGAFILRDGVQLIHVADAISRSGGDWPGQIQPGYNIVTVRGGTFAQHHTFRRF
jgi:hypothetical protein